MNTPFNDNYPDAKTCINRRCHAHIWAVGTASYVCALRMGAYAPHLGLMLTSGCLEGYSIKERDGKKSSSNTRGIICLCPAATQLAPGATYSFSWRLFTHLGRPDFFDQLLARGGVQVTAQRYVGEMGEKLSYTVRTAQGSETKSYRIAATGDIRVPISWQGGETYFELLGGNLSLFTEDGRGGAAFLYPLRVNGQPAHGLNPLANDQDFALMFYLKWIRLKQ